MKFRITILCENGVGPISGTMGEHGFSALVEWREGALLWDTGQGFTLLHNAQRMHKNLHDLQYVAISHGHYDHTGGLLPLLRTCGKKTVFAHPEIFTPRYRCKDTGEVISLGAPYPREYLEGQGATFNFAEQFREILPGIHLSGTVKRSNDFELGDSGLYLDTNRTMSDPFNDDQALILETEKGLLVLLGCCHAGLINTLEHIKEKTGAQKFYAILGGTHLGFCSKEQLEQTVTLLKDYKIDKLAASHCTGFNASARLMREFPAAFQLAQVGYSLEV